MGENKKTCPCGSGAPYLECCGASGKSVLLDQVRWRRAGGVLRRKLGEYADQTALCWDAARAQDIYLGCLDELLMLQDDDFTMERCFEWFIFDFHTHGGPTIIERFYEEKGDLLDNYERKLLDEWRNARISLYEVLEVSPARGIVMEDLLGGEKVTIREINATAEIIRGCLVLIRVLKIGEEHEFSTSGLALPERYKPVLLAKLAADRVRFCEKRGNPIQGWDTYLRERSHKINAWVTKYGIAPAPVKENQPELPNEQYSTAYRIKDWQTALDYFKNSPDFIVTCENRDKDDELIEAVAIYLGKGWGAHALQAVRARMVLTANSLIIIAQSTIMLKRAKWFNYGLINNLTADEAEEAKNQENLTGQAQDYFTWSTPGYETVARQVQEGMEALGYNHIQQKGAVQIWFDYCSKEHPAIRKDEVWTATVIYAYTRLEKTEEVKQQDLAGQYGVSSSTISHSYSLLCRSLELVDYDRRYTTKKPAIKGYRR